MASELLSIEMDPSRFMLLIKSLYERNYSILNSSSFEAVLFVVVVSWVLLPSDVHPCVAGQRGESRDPRQP